MKMYKVLYICILGLLAGIPGIQAQQRDTLRTMDGRDSLIVERVIVRDTVFLLKEEYEEQLDSTDIIHTRAIGRFDRGIKNYRFIPKGKWIGGLTFSYVNFDSDDSRLLFSILKDFDCNFRTFSVKPFWGYAIRDNLVVGMKLGYNHTIAQLDNVSLAVEDLDVSLKDMRKIPIRLQSFTVLMSAWITVSVSVYLMKLLFLIIEVHLVFLVEREII